MFSLECLADACLDSLYMMNTPALVLLFGKMTWKQRGMLECLRLEC